MSDRTVVGWDGSLESRLALEWAVARALDEHDGILLVDIEDAKPGAVVTEQMVAERHLAADAEAERIAAQHPGLRISTHIMAGDRLDELRRFAHPDTLVVVGTGRRTRPHTRYSWSIGARLAAVASGAVAIVPGLPEEDRSMVVAGVDGSEVSMKAARFAAREARRTRSGLRLVHAWFEPIVAARGVGVDVRFLHEIRGEHQRILESAEHTIQAANPDLPVTALLVHGDAPHGLADAVADARLLVVGTEQAHGIGRMLLGSTSHALILDIAVPTIVVSPDTLI
jgi:nucleotide-binding universal stress UspA family protein